MLNLTSSDDDDRPLTRAELEAILADADAYRRHLDKLKRRHPLRLVKLGEEEET